MTLGRLPVVLGLRARVEDVLGPVRISFLRIGALGIGLLLGSTVGPVSAGHTYPNPTGGDCWRIGTPLWCRTSFATTHDMRIRTIDQIGGGFTVNINEACNNWHNYSPSTSGTGDIWCHPSAVYGDSYVYFKLGTDVEILSWPIGALALTINCTTGGSCSGSSTQSQNTWYSEIKIAAGAVGPLNETQETWVFAHEMGHALGLWHHGGSDLMNPTVNNFTGPNSTDYGLLPACSGAASTYGVRCIYHALQ